MWLVLRLGHKRPAAYYMQGDRFANGALEGSEWLIQMTPIAVGANATHCRAYRVYPLRHARLSAATRNSSSVELALEDWWSGTEWSVQSIPIRVVLWMGSGKVTEAGWGVVVGAVRLCE